MILFGSHARRENRPGSDHDLLVVIDGLPRDPFLRNREVRLTLLPVLDQLPGPIGFVAKTPEEIDANLTPLLLDIFFDGVCLYGHEYFKPLQKKALSAIQQAGLQRERIGGEWSWRFSTLPSKNWEISWEGYRELS